MSLLTPQDFRALGTGCRVVTDARHTSVAMDVVIAQLADIDRACSRFRDDSEITLVNSRAGKWTTVSFLFLRALDVALRAARLTDGAVDPTVGNVMRAIGYDRDFAEVGNSRPVKLRLEEVPGWRAVEVDYLDQRIRIPKGTALDFGATAKALAADMAAQAAFDVTNTGLLVSLGGDIAVAGPAPEGGWSVDISDSHANGDVYQTVAFDKGALATSSVTVRRWVQGAIEMHHIVDPATKLPAENIWRTVSVFAGSCVDANIASTASIIKGEAAPQWLRERGLSARLTRANGQVVSINEWPEEL